MTLEQLRIFVAVAQREHVTQASRALKLTQSATSAAIAALEARYHIKLFDRVGRRIALTQTGRLFLEEAKEILARVEAAELAISDLTGLKRGFLTIGASQTVGNYWMPARLHAFNRRYPGISLRLRIGNTEQIAAAVLDGSADLAVVEGEVNHPLLSCRKFEGDTMIVAVGINHPWARLRQVTPKELTSTTWALREPGSGTRAIFEATLAHYNMRLSDLEIAMELPSNEAVRAVIECGGSATAISSLVVAGSIANKTLHKVQFALPKRSFTIVRHSERYESKAEAAFIDTIRTP